MADDNLVLEHLRHIRSRVDRIDEAVSEVKHRLATLERGQAKGHSDYADLYGDQARQQSSMDRVVERLDRIEQCLELADD